MGDIRQLLIEQHRAYPLAGIEDMLKLLYQNEFGCGHMVSDEAHSLDWIKQEAEALAGRALEGPAFESIGNGLCRLNLRILRQSALSGETLNRFFLRTANAPRGSAQGFEEKAALLIALCEEGTLPFDAAEVSRALEESCAAGHPAVSHSGAYRAAYAPAYRVVDKAYCDYLPLFQGIDEKLARGGPLTVAIDGNSAGGKSSLARLLQTVYDCNVFRMDDFFLQPHQRTPERLAEPGGNVDYERFEEEVLEPLRSGEPFSYRPYDCQTLKLSGAVCVTPCSLNIVEGVYSLHPRFGDYSGLKVFLGLGEAEQRRRIQQRNPGLYDRFMGEWVPMESRYFEAFSISSKCDLILRTDSF